MSKSRFLQIHTLHAYTAALLNRDDTGQAKRLQFGGTSRTRISSQCLKRHWRMAEDDPSALSKIDGFVGSSRSRELVTLKVIEPLRKADIDKDVIQAIDSKFQKWVYGDSADKGKKNRQTLLLGEPELTWLAAQALKIAQDNKTVKEAEKALEALTKTPNLKALAENSKMPGGLAAALFGRMITSDPEANIDAPVYVAHAFTVHTAETEGDYFVAVDDLAKDEDTGADTIQETELTSGLFYGYVVIDMPSLIKNCGGDHELAARVVHNLVYLIAEVSPGAKLGSTAPFGRAELMLLESGTRQPRSLASAFRDPVGHNGSALHELQKQLKAFDEAYKTGEERAHLSISGQLDGIAKMNIDDLAKWAEQQVLGAAHD